MNNLRIWILALVVWLPLTVFVEHTLVLPQYRHNILLFLLSTVAVVLLSPKPLPTRLTIFGFVLAFIATGILQNGYADELENLYLTGTRIGAIMVTGLIAHQINTHLYQVEEAIANLALSDYLPLPAHFADGQTAMYREMQRARHHGRPLSLVMLQMDEPSQQAALPQVAEELRRSMVKKFLLAKVAAVLNDHLPRFHSFALRQDCFVAALPETTSAEALELMRAVNSITSAEVGVTLHAGVASLSDEITTFGSLLELAEERLHQAEAGAGTGGDMQAIFETPYAGSDANADANTNGYSDEHPDGPSQAARSAHVALGDTEEWVLDRDSTLSRNG
jgi:GGDEF domain-containing protein